MNNWYGPIQIEKIENTPASARAGEDFIPLNDTHVKFIHYPDCQQLIIWLPRPGREYGNLRLLEQGTGENIGEWPVADKLNGSIQVLWDTLPIQPGSYRIEISWKEGFQHLLHLRKYKEGETIQVPVKEVLKEEVGSAPLQYRDGFGNVIDAEDLRLREKVIKDIQGKFSRTLEYISEGRSGTVVYVEGDTRLPFFYELGGGNCVAWIDIPTPQQWEADTKLPLSRRDDIIRFVAQRAQAQQAPGCSIRITDSSISFLERN